MIDNLVSLKVDVADGVAEVTLLGPGKGNAMGRTSGASCPLVFGELDADDEVRAVVLTGSGANFSYGLDLPAMMPALGGRCSAATRSPSRAPTSSTRSARCRARSPRWPAAASR